MRSVATHRFPLRVLVYEQIANAIRDGTFPVGTQLPTEPELCDSLGVSRTVLREALVLLEEDGLLRMRRGVGRFVLRESVPAGLRRLRAVEKLIADEGGLVEIRRIQVEVEEPSYLNQTQLRVGEHAELGFWESVLSLDGEPACLTMEWSAPDDVLAAAHPELPGWLSDGARLPCTMLGRLLDGPDLGAPRSLATLSASVLGTERAAIAGLAPDVPMLQLRQVLSDDSGQPLVLAKSLLAPCVPPLALFQTS